MCGVVPPSGGGAAQRKATHRQLLITSANKRQTLTFSEDWRMWQRKSTQKHQPPHFSKLADNLKPKHGLLKFYKFLRTNVRRAKCIRSSPSMIVNAKNIWGVKNFDLFFHSECTFKDSSLTHPRAETLNICSELSLLPQNMRIEEKSTFISTPPQRQNSDKMLRYLWCANIETEGCGAISINITHCPHPR